MFCTMISCTVVAVSFTSRFSVLDYTGRLTSIRETQYARCLAQNVVSSYRWNGEWTNTIVLWKGQNSLPWTHKQVAFCISTYHSWPTRVYIKATAPELLRELPLCNSCTVADDPKCYAPDHLGPVPWYNNLCFNYLWRMKSMTKTLVPAQYCEPEATHLPVATLQF